MQFGLFSNNRRPKRRLGEGWALDLAETCAAEEAGFAEVWFSEHEAPAEMLISKASAMTRRIMLGTGVRPLPFYHPVQVALEANACDQITNGRYMLGMGPGFRPQRLTLRGLDPEQRRDMMAESLPVILRLLQNPGEKFDHDGVHWRGKQLYVEIESVQKPHVPIGISVLRTRESALQVGRLGVMLLTADFTSNRQLRDIGDWLEEGQVSAGRPADRSQIRACRVVYVADTDKQARDDMRDCYNETIRWEVANTPWHQQDRIPAGGTFDDINFDYLCDIGNLLIGSPATVTQMIEDFHRDVGGFGTLHFHAGRDYATPEKMENSIRLFGEKVAPDLKDLQPHGELQLAR